MIEYVVKIDVNDSRLFKEFARYMSSLDERIKWTVEDAIVINALARVKERLEEIGIEEELS